MTENIAPIVTTDWLAANLGDSRLRIVDVTPYQPQEASMKNKLKNLFAKPTSKEENYDQQHIPGALAVDLSSFAEAEAAMPFTPIAHEDFVEKVTKLGIGDGTIVVIYDGGFATGGHFTAPVMAARFAWQLSYEGFDNVAVLEGGFQKWLQEDKPVTAEVVTYPVAKYTGARREELIAFQDEVLAATTDDSVVLIDALPAEYFSGKKNFFGKDRAGHIPSSANVHCESLVDPATGRIQDKATLEKLFAGSGALDENSKVITYCRGGVTATFDWLVLTYLGKNNAAVYDRSLSEWANDESLPLERG